MAKRRAWQPSDYLERAVPRQLMQAAPDARSRALVAVLYYAGLRAFEAAALDVGDVDLRLRRLHIRHGKGDKEAWLPISDPLARELTPYIKGLAPSEGPLFRGRKRGAAGDYRISYWTVWQTIKRLGQLAGLDPEQLHPHLFRHGFVSHLLEAGVPLHEVRDLARHSNIATTSLYANANPRRLLGSANKLEDDDE